MICTTTSHAFSRPYYPWASIKMMVVERSDVVPASAYDLEQKTEELCLSHLLQAFLLVLEFIVL